MGENPVAQPDQEPQEPVIADEQLRRVIGNLSEQLSTQQIEWPLLSTKAIDLIRSNSDITSPTLFVVYDHLKGKRRIQMEQVPYGRQMRNAFNSDQLLALAAVGHVAQSDARYNASNFKDLVEDTKEKLGDHPLSSTLFTIEESGQSAKQQEKKGDGNNPGELPDDSVEHEDGRKQVKEYMIELQKNRTVTLPLDIRDVLGRISRAYSALKEESEIPVSVERALKICERLLERNPDVNDLSELADRLEDDLAGKDD